MRRSLTYLLAVYLAIAAAVAIPLSDLYQIHSLSRQTNLAPPDLNINVGGPRVGRFMGDQYGWLVGVANTDAFNKNNAVIGGAEAKNEPMYKSHRYGKPVAGSVPWGYDIPVAEPGTYGCTVHFAETDTTAFRNGERVFDLSIQGKGPATTFKGIDVYKETKGGQFVVLTKTAPRVVVTGILKIRVAKAPASSHGAFIAGITCERTGNLPAGAVPDKAPPGAIRPPKYAAIGNVFPTGPIVLTKSLNINNGGDAVGRFLKDNPVYLHYGPSSNFSIPNQPIGGAEAINRPALDSSRYGLKGSDFGYQIPISSSGKWACTLHFAELYDGAKAGQRVFHIQVQDQIMENIDVMAGTGNALFTSYTRTFPEVIVADSLMIRLIAVKGDPFINAITCVLETPMTEAQARKLLAARASLNGVKPIAPVPPSVPAATPPAAAAPTAEAPIDPTANDTGLVPEASVGPAAEAILADIALETAPEALEGEIQQPYNLAVTVTNGTNVDGVFRDAVKRTMMTGSKVPIEKWAITSWTVAEAPVSTLASFALADSDTNFAVTAVANVKNESLTSVNDVVSAYLESNDGTTELQKTHPGATIGLASPIVKAQSAEPKAKKGNTSVIVAAVVGSCLGLLLIVAVIAFFVIQNHRKNEVNPTGFDDPPPPLTDSDGEAPSSSAHSEDDDDDSQPRGNNSIDYLDDDSTFTAATSRQGDPENGVTLDKDVWGRPSS